MTTHVRFWPKADMARALHMSAFGGKADIATGGPKKDLEGLHVEAAGSNIKHKY